MLETESAYKTPISKEVSVESLQPQMCDLNNYT